MPPVVLHCQRVAIAKLCLKLVFLVIGVLPFVFLVIFLSMGLNTPILRARARSLLCLHAAAQPSARAWTSPLLHRADASHRIHFIALLRVSASSRVPARLDAIRPEIITVLPVPRVPGHRHPGLCYAWELFLVKDVLAFEIGIEPAHVFPVTQRD
jgi:hypothetical protein